MRFVHEIPLSFVTKNTNVDQLTSELIEKNRNYLNPKVVSQNQVKRLVERLVRHMAGGNNKENAQLDNNSNKNKGFSLMQQVPAKKNQVMNDQNSNGRKLQPLEMSPTESE